MNFIKNILRAIVALILLFILSPIFFLVSLSILFDDGHPILFKQDRIGRNNKIFKIIKFRTMKKDMPDTPTHLLKKDINYYTKIGPFLRKYSLDELPQLVNIIFGDVGFIGPRPALYNQFDLIKLRDKKKISSMLPGITGWAQVNGRDYLSIEEKVNCEYYYFKKKSILLNIKIIFLTILRVLKSEGVSKI
tara:strand:+ start:1679 stop:2251 length:573 start_codon:yes stop_codon:yes gene_type:complete